MDAAVLSAGQDLPTVLAEVLTAVGVRMATVERQRTLARYELSLAAVRDPALRAELVAGGDMIRRRGAALLAGPVSSDRTRPPRSWRRCSTGSCTRLWCAGRTTPTPWPPGCGRRFTGW